VGTIALGWGWLAAPLSASLLTVVGTVATVIGTVAAVVSVRAARRGLYVSTVAVDRTWDFQPADGRRASRHGPDLHGMVIRFTCRGGTAIEADHFDNQNDLVFDVGARIIQVLECRTEPPDAPKPEFRFRDNSLFLPPAMINPGTSVYVSLLTAFAPARPITCTHAVLANVRVQSVEDADTRARAYLASLLGAAAIPVTLLVALALPALAATVGYRVAASLTCVIAFAVIVAAKIRKPWPAATLSVTVLLGLMASIGWLAVTPARAGYSPPAPRPNPTPAPVSCPSAGGGDWVTVYHAGRNDNETVGYSSSKHVFVNQSFPRENLAQRTQDQRVKLDEQLIYAANAQVDCAAWDDHQNGGERPVVELAYFAGLTEGVDEDYDAGEAEELEGLLAAQRNSLNSPDSASPLLKIVIANGGSKMADAAQVAVHLAALAREDHALLGVVGMDRSVTQVQTAIRLFAKDQVPVVATTLSADGIGQGASPYYYQLSPANSAEAALIRQYIQLVVHAYFKESKSAYPSDGSAVATRIVIEEPDRNPDDRYIVTLVNDLITEAWRSYGLRQPQVIYSPGSALCGDSVVDIYAGRHDKPVGKGVPYNNDFSGFLSYIHTSCKGPQPFIIADDGVTRFVADPAARELSTQYGLAISYVTKGIAVLRTGSTCLHQQSAASIGDTFGAFCRAYAGIVTTLRGRVKGQDFLWTGERVGLAYDAAELFLTAVNRGGPLTPAQIPRRFQLDGEVRGVTGAVDFAASNIGDNSPQGMPMAIVRLDLSKSWTLPTCAFPGHAGYLYGPGPGPCPNNQG
jgi:hypothetical protein